MQRDDAYLFFYRRETRAREREREEEIDLERSRRLSLCLTKNIQLKVTVFFHV